MAAPQIDDGVTGDQKNKGPVLAVALVAVAATVAGVVWLLNQSSDEDGTTGSGDVTVEGIEVWRADTGLDNANVLGASDDVVVLGARGDTSVTYQARRISDGRLVWEVELAVPDDILGFQGQPDVRVVDDAMVLVLSLNEANREIGAVDLVALSIADGSEMWRTPVDPAATPMFGPDAWVSFGDIEVMQGRRAVQVVDSRTGAVRFTSDADDGARLVALFPDFMVTSMRVDADGGDAFERYLARGLRRPRTLEC